MIKAIINYNDVNDEFRRMNDILGILKYKYKNINVSYKKVRKKNELFLTINNERLECHHNLGFYMQAVENILNNKEKGI
ncbi:MULTISPECIES: hypothetical protein [Brachyspira]|uniref:Uncharacterized protein n=1 Tax=Brachyspira murdochii (strain ATCC 51284 / DSM 12563 / 56-150) TaxID=526224 RepID=D5UAS1_BRAM5|nr:MULTISPECIES: hypothetical protein [Brachyspira]ADG71794.1 conserved hypothetical protein [Brachyspira murdochii DSM 12563]WPC23184.1 hypothetical protein N4239_09560 [Brachyspira hyodysenteriae]WPC23882.1 hypothetical protein N4239_13175 [Brachyspira hyodysenteriae]WPC24412.1 hypothetical protein N4239_01130 [Brachyspira hyodysenteriae]WPC25170.1 hypothetical protein N4239_05045 [Brachyspira hyodysenteriae]